LLLLLVGVKGELHGVWKTSVDAAGRKVEVRGERVDVAFTSVEMRGASEDVEYGRVFVACEVDDASFTERDAS